jgi:hypothetical protein
MNGVKTDGGHGQRKRGRPRGGEKPGDRVRDYPTLTVRFPPDERNYLDAVRDTVHHPLWRVIQESVRLYVDALGPKWKEAIQRRFKQLERARKRATHRVDSPGS